MESKTKNQSEGRKLSIGSLKAAGFYLPAVLIVALVLIFSAVFFKHLFGEKAEITPAVQTQDNNKNNADNNISPNAAEIRITTNKEKYVNEEQIALHIENLGNSPAYFQPCKDIKVFEKKEGDTWKLMEPDNSFVDYQNAAFEKKDGNAECDIEPPIWGAGTYRAVVPIYFNCTKPSPYACEWSKIFYSNEFKLEAITDLGDDNNKNLE